VPEATIDKNSNRRPSERDIRASRESAHIHAIPEPSPSQFASQQQLRTRPSSGKLRHKAAHRRAGRLWPVGPSGLGAHR
jgi:hypothetical protein